MATPCGSRRSGRDDAHVPGSTLVAPQQGPTGTRARMTAAETLLRVRCASVAELSGSGHLLSCDATLSGTGEAAALTAVAVEIQTPRIGQDQLGWLLKQGAPMKRPLASALRTKSRRGCSRIDSSDFLINRVVGATFGIVHVSQMATPFLVGGTSV